MLCWAWALFFIRIDQLNQHEEANTKEKPLRSNVVTTYHWETLRLTIILQYEGECMKVVEWIILTLKVSNQFLAIA